MTAPMTVYKDAGKWWYDCRLCHWANPVGSATRGVACVRAEMHWDVAHSSPLQRSFR